MRYKVIQTQLNEVKKYLYKKVIYSEDLTIYTQYKKPITIGHKRLPYESIINFDNVEDALSYIEDKQSKKPPQEVLDKKSNTRTKEKIKDVIRSNIGSKSYFLTLTFAYNITSYKEALEYWVKFIRRFKHQFKYDLQYLVVVEIQEEREIKYGHAVIHFHCILFNGRYIKDLKWLESIWSHGAINYKKIHNYSEPERISNYISKYLSKQKIDGRKYFTSKNIKKPQVLLSCDFASKDFLQALDSSQVKTKTRKHAYIHVVSTK